MWQKISPPVYNSKQIIGEPMSADLFWRWSTCNVRLSTCSCNSSLDRCKRRTLLDCISTWNHMIVRPNLCNGSLLSCCMHHHTPHLLHIHLKSYDCKIVNPLDLTDKLQHASHVWLTAHPSKFKWLWDRFYPSDHCWIAACIITLARYGSSSRPSMCCSTYHTNYLFDCTPTWNHTIVKHSWSIESH